MRSGNGGIIGRTNTSTAASTYGIWSMKSIHRKVLDASWPQPAFTITFSTTHSQGLERATNGEELNNWAGKFWQNLPEFLVNSLATNGVNESNTNAFTITTPSTLRIWLARQPNWSDVPLDDFIQYGIYDPGFITSYSGMILYYRDFPAGTYSFDDYSAIYFLTDVTNNPSKVLI